MNHQKVFKKVAKHLNKQGHPAKDKHGSCVYKTNGDMCAIGCLIEDGKYRQKMDNDRWSIGNLIQKGVLPTECRGELSFLEDLQHAHDDTDPNEWRTLKETFKLFAEKWNLDAKFLKNLKFKPH